MNLTFHFQCNSTLPAPLPWLPASAFSTQQPRVISEHLGHYDHGTPSEPPGAIHRPAPAHGCPTEPCSFPTDPRPRAPPQPRPPPAPSSGPCLPLPLESPPASSLSSDPHSWPPRSHLTRRRALPRPTSPSGITVVGGARSLASSLLIYFLTFSWTRIKGRGAQPCGERCYGAGSRCLQRLRPTRGVGVSVPPPARPLPISPSHSGTGDSGQPPAGCKPAPSVPQSSPARPRAAPWAGARG